jgi:hypothetical protein
VKLDRFEQLMKEASVRALSHREIDELRENYNVTDTRPATPAESESLRGDESSTTRTEATGPASDGATSGPATNTGTPPATE